MCLKILIRESLFFGKKENWDQITPLNSPRARGTILKFGEEKVHREVLSISVSLMSVVLALPTSSRGHKRKPCTKKDAPAEQHGTWREIFTSSKNSDKTTFYSPIEIKATPAPISQLPEEREFVVDSGAAMQLLSKKNLSSDELETLRRCRNLTVAVTAKGKLQANEEAQFYVHDFGFFVTVQLLEDTLLQSYRFEKSAKNSDILMCERSTTTTGQTRENNSMQNGLLRTYCYPWCVRQFW